VPKKTEYVKNLSVPKGVKICKPKILDRPINKTTTLNNLSVVEASMKDCPAKIIKILSAKPIIKKIIGKENVNTKFKDFSINLLKA
jgi:hypothetical protein